MISSRIFSLKIVLAFVPEVVSYQLRLQCLFWVSFSFSLIFVLHFVLSISWDIYILDKLLILDLIISKNTVSIHLRGDPLIFVLIH